MRWRVESGACAWSKIQFILRNSWSRSKTKVLQEAGEEDEELHPGQTLSKTSPATFKRKKTKGIWWSRLQVSAHQEVMAKFTNLQKKAWRHLAWGTSHLCPRSEQDKNCGGAPTHSHHTGRMSREETLWYPVDKTRSISNTVIYRGRILFYQLNNGCLTNMT